MPSTFLSTPSPAQISPTNIAKQVHRSLPRDPTHRPLLRRQPVRRLPPLQQDAHLMRKLHPPLPRRRCHRLVRLRPSHRHRHSWPPQLDLHCQHHRWRKWHHDHQRNRHRHASHLGPDHNSSLGDPERRSEDGNWCRCIGHRCCRPNALNFCFSV